MFSCCIRIFQTLKTLFFYIKNIERIQSGGGFIRVWKILFSYTTCKYNRRIYSQHIDRPRLSLQRNFYSFHIVVDWIFRIADKYLCILLCWKTTIVNRCLKNNKTNKLIFARGLLVYFISSDVNVYWRETDFYMELRVGSLNRSAAIGRTKRCSIAKNNCTSALPIIIRLFGKWLCDIVMMKLTATFTAKRLLAERSFDYCTSLWSSTISRLPCKRISEVMMIAMIADLRHIVRDDYSVHRCSYLFSSCFTQKRFVLWFSSFCFIDIYPIFQ